MDEVQHFSSARLTTLRLYADDVPLGFDLAEFISLCERHGRKADGSWANRPRRGFPGPGTRTRQRAYHDALRDIVAPAMGYAPVIRIPEFNADGHAAYRKNRDRIRTALGLA